MSFAKPKSRISAWPRAKAADQGGHSPFDTYPTPSRTCACATGGRCGDKRYAWPLFIPIRAACAKERSCGTVRGGRPAMVVRDLIYSTQELERKRLPREVQRPLVCSRGHEK